MVVDPKGNDYEHYSGATVITPNRAELAQVTGQSIESEDDLVAAAKSLMDSIDTGAVLVTRSADGMSLIEKKRNGFTLACRKPRSR